MPSLSSRYIENLQTVLEHAITVRSDNMRKEEEYRELYPKTHMLMKVQRMLKEKEGQSDFEIHVGQSELLMDEAAFSIHKPRKIF